MYQEPTGSSSQSSALQLHAGTPVQNNMGELYGLLNLLDHKKFPSEEDFYERFGGGGQVSTVDQIHALRVSSA